MDEMCIKRENKQGKLYKTTSENDNKITKLTFGLSFYNQCVNIITRILKEEVVRWCRKP